MYVVVTTVINVDHMTLEATKEFALKARQQGTRSEILSDAEAKRRGFLDPNMQDLTKLRDWKDVT